MSAKDQVPGPIEAIIAATSGGEPVDWGNQEVARALRLALQELNFCDDTLAILVYRFGLGGKEAYAQIRRVFPHGSGDE